MALLTASRDRTFVVVVSRLGSSSSGLSTGLRSPIVSSGSTTYTVPYSRLAARLQQIRRMGGVIEGIYPKGTAFSVNTTASVAPAIAPTVLPSPVVELPTPKVVALEQPTAINSEPWWIAITTQSPTDTLYFGPYDSAAEAKQAEPGFIEDLETEGAQGISVSLTQMEDAEAA